MSSPVQVVRGARLPALPAPLAMIAGSLSVQLGGALAVLAFSRATPLGVTRLSMHPAVAALVGAAVLSQGLGVRDVIAIAFVVAASTGALAAAARVRAAQ